MIEAINRELSLIMFNNLTGNKSQLIIEKRFSLYKEREWVTELAKKSFYTNR